MGNLILLLVASVAAGVHTNSILVGVGTAAGLWFLKTD
jgi:hypothetical protein